MDNINDLDISIDDLQIEELDVSQFLDASISESKDEVSKVMAASCTTCECCCSCSILALE